MSEEVVSIQCKHDLEPTCANLLFTSRKYLKHLKGFNELRNLQTLNMTFIFHPLYHCLRCRFLLMKRMKRNFWRPELSCTDLMAKMSLQNGRLYRKYSCILVTNSLFVFFTGARHWWTENTQTQGEWLIQDCNEEGQNIESVRQPFHHSLDGAESKYNQWKSIYLHCDGRLCRWTKQIWMFGC